MPRSNYVPVTYKGMQETGIPLLVFDILETHYGTWFSEAEVVEAVLLLRPDATRANIHKAVQRMTHREDAVVEVRRIIENNQPRVHLRVPTRDYWEEPHEVPDRNNGHRSGGVHPTHPAARRPV